MPVVPAVVVISSGATGVSPAIVVVAISTGLTGVAWAAVLVVISGTLLGRANWYKRISSRAIAGLGDSAGRGGDVSGDVGPISSNCSAKDEPKWWLVMRRSVC